MRSWGYTLILIAVLSKVLPYFGMQLILMAWADRWGELWGWVIRGAFAVAGLVMILAAKPRAKV